MWSFTTISLVLDTFRYSLFFPAPWIYYHYCWRQDIPFDAISELHHLNGSMREETFVVKRQCRQIKRKPEHTYTQSIHRHSFYKEQIKKKTNLVIPEPEPRTCGFLGRGLRDSFGNFEFSIFHFSKH